MAVIPNILHYVFGMKPQNTAFHLLHYLAIESARQVLRPERIHLYYHHLPYGYYWDLIRPHLSLQRVEPAAEVLAAPCDDRLSPPEYRYAHHADVIRLEALIEYGGLYADIDTLFLRPIPKALYQQPFVISREGLVRNEITGAEEPSLCNAVMMAQPGSEFARLWRARIGAAMNGSWSNHSCFLPRLLSEQYPDWLWVEPFDTFLGVPLTPEGIEALLERDGLDLADSCCIHLGQHLWWSANRRDFSPVHGGELTLDTLRGGTSTLCRLARPFLPEVDPATLGPAVR